MTTKPKKRQAKAAPKSTQKAKVFSGKSKFKSEAERKYALARRITEEADSLKSSISEQQDKAKEQSLWASIGGALGGLALGVATGGLGWAAQGAAVGIGSYVGGRGGKAASEKKDLLGIGKRLKGKGEIDTNLKHKGKDFLFYKDTAESQEKAFTEFDEALDKGIAQKSLMAGIFAGAMAGGAEALGDYYTKMKDARAAKAMGTGSKTLPVAGEVAGSMSQPISLTATGEPAYAAMASKGVGYKAASGLKSIEATKDLASIISPVTTEAVPSLFAGLGESMKKYALYSGGAAIAGYRPEMKKLKPMMTTSSNKQYG